MTAFKLLNQIFFNNKESLKTSIYIPFNKFQDIGGPSTFMKLLKNHLDKKEFSYLNSPKKAKVIFFSVNFSKKILADLKNKGGKAIQRLDGIYYPAKHQNRYLELNKPIQDIYSNYADFIIFQSEHCKEQCFSMFGEKNKNQYSIVLNGADKSIFFPEKTPELKAHKKIKFITTGKFRNIDMVEPIINALETIQDKIDFEYKLLGPIKIKNINPFLKRDYLSHAIERDPKKIAILLRKSDIFLYSFLNPPCPNSVIEAISCGLPVVGFNSGAMAELMFFSKDLLAPVSNDIFQKYEDFDSEKLAEKILWAVKNYKYYKQKALDHSHLYSFEECGQKYLNIFQKFC